MIPGGCLKLFIILMWVMHIKMIAIVKRAFNAAFLGYCWFDMSPSDIKPM